MRGAIARGGAAARGPIVIRPGRLPLSWTVDRRVPPVLLILGLATVVATVLSVGYGQYFIAPLDVLRTFLGLETGNPNHPFVVTTLRLPRVLIAFLVGLALALAGTIAQGLARNPLASPDILGVNAGASLAAVALIVLAPAAPFYLVPPAAFAGALVVAALIAALSLRGGGSPIRLVLIGVGFAAVAGALTTALLTLGRTLFAARALIWLAGSVYGRSWRELWAILPWLAVFVPLALLLARHLDVLHLGDDVARGLGSRLALWRGLLLLTAVALAGAAVATAGAVGFVGLMTPHLARRLVGPAHAGLLPTAALTGGLIVLLADLAGRTLFAPVELPCGVITAIIGAPYFFYLLYQSGGS